MWSKYVFITRKAFCQVAWPPSGLTFTLVASCIFLVPVSLLVYNLFNNVKDETEADENPKLKVDENNDAIDAGSQTRLQCAVGLFLLTWCPYVVESFFSVTEEVPNLVGLVCAFIPIFTTTLIPLWYLKWRRQAEKAARPGAYILQC
jgi:1,4-dihydroxy-2-naphthoate octaprenyltransferase